MLTRRSALATALPAVIARPAHAANDFQNFVAGIYAQVAAEFALAVSTGLVGRLIDYLDALLAGRYMNHSSPLAVLEVECRSSGAEHCRFIAGSAEVMQHIYDRMSAGADHLTAIRELS